MKRGLFFLFSPFEVKLGTEAGPQQVRAWGPGLESGVVGKSADFVVEAVGDDVGTLGKSVLFLAYGPLGRMYCIVASNILLCLKLLILKLFNQVSQWRAHPRQRLNVMIREMAPAMCGTGPQNQANMRCMCFVRTRTSSSARSWLRSCKLQEKIFSLTR